MFEFLFDISEVQNAKWVLLAQIDVCEYIKFHCSPSADKIKLYGCFEC